MIDSFIFMLHIRRRIKFHPLSVGRGGTIKSSLELNCVFIASENMAFFNRKDTPSLKYRSKQKLSDKKTTRIL